MVRIINDHTIYRVGVKTMNLIAEGEIKVRALLGCELFIAFTLRVNDPAVEVPLKLHTIGEAEVMDFKKLIVDKSLADC